MDGVRGLTELSLRHHRRSSGASCRRCGEVRTRLAVALEPFEVEGIGVFSVLGGEPCVSGGN